MVQHSLIDHTGITGVGVGGGGAPDLLYSEKLSADTPDDEFDAATLDAKWTATAGAAGTISLLEGGNVAKYDLATRPGFLLLQVGSAATQQVLLRQDWTLPDGASIVAAFSLAFHTASVTNDELQIGLSLNNDDSSYIAGAACLGLYGVEVDAGAPGIQTLVTGSSGGQATVSISGREAAYGETLFLRIARAGLSYYPMISFDGRAWVQFGGTSYAAAFSNLWIFAANAATSGTPVPIQAVAWIRQGTNGVDPWPWA